MIWQSTWKREIMKQFPDVVRRSFQVNPCKCFHNQYTHNMYDLTWLFYILRMDQPRLIKGLWNSWTLEALLINTMPSTCSWNQKINCSFIFLFSIKRITYSINVQTILTILSAQWWTNSLSYFPFFRMIKRTSMNGFKPFCIMTIWDLPELTVFKTNLKLNWLTQQN